MREFLPDGRSFVIKWKHTTTIISHAGRRRRGWKLLQSVPVSRAHLIILFSFSLFFFCFLNGLATVWGGHGRVVRARAHTHVGRTCGRRGLRRRIIISRSSAARWMLHELLLHRGSEKQGGDPGDADAPGRIVVPLFSNRISMSERVSIGSIRSGRCVSERVLRGEIIRSENNKVHTDVRPKGLCPPPPPAPRAISHCRCSARAKKRSVNCNEWPLRPLRRTTIQFSGYVKVLRRVSAAANDQCKFFLFLLARTTI